MSKSLILLIALLTLGLTSLVLASPRLASRQAECSGAGCAKECDDCSQAATDVKPCPDPAGCQGQPPCGK